MLRLCLQVPRFENQYSKPVVLSFGCTMEAPRIFFLNADGWDGALLDLLT